MSIEALSMVLNHSKATGSQKVIMLGIANHLGPDAVEGAWPSQRRLAEYANMTERGVQKCIDKLVAIGELRVEVSAGHSRNQYKPNRYWITIECPPDCDRSMSHRRGEQVYAESRTPVPSGANASTVRGEQEFVLTVIEPKLKPEVNSMSRKVYASDFEQWWSVYPVRKGKGAAEKAYKKALTKVSREFLLQAVTDFRDDPHRPESYLPNPATWLNEERWEDEPYKPRIDYQPRKLTNAEHGLLLVQKYRAEEAARQAQPKELDYDMGLRLKGVDDE
jgi:hypothetical protein